MKTSSAFCIVTLLALFATSVLQAKRPKPPVRPFDEYQYLFCQNSGHGIGNAKIQFLAHAIEWVWHGYKTKD